MSAKEGKHTLKRKPQTRTERVWVNAVFNSLHEILFFKAKCDALVSTGLTHSGVCPSTGQEERFYHSQQLLFFFFLQLGSMFLCRAFFFVVVVAAFT